MAGAVIYEPQPPVARITIAREERRNAINPDVVWGISEALERAESDDSVTVVVLTGAGERAFCAGADLGGMTETSRVGQHFVRAELGDLFKQMRGSPLPIVARVNGHALAGGFGLMLACDLVVAADDAEFGTPEVNIGLWPFMISALIQRNIATKVALEMMLTGRRMTADEAVRSGFVNRVAPRAELDRVVAELTGVLASKSPLLVSLGKRSFYASEDMELSQGLDYLAGMLTLALESEDAIEGVSAFLEKRTPEWKGR